MHEQHRMIEGVISKKDDERMAQETHLRLGEIDVWIYRNKEKERREERKQQQQKKNRPDCIARVKNLLARESAAVRRRNNGLCWRLPVGWNRIYNTRRRSSDLQCKESLFFLLLIFAVCVLHLIRSAFVLCSWWWWKPIVNKCIQQSRNWLPPYIAAIAADQQV